MAAPSYAAEFESQGRKPNIFSMAAMTEAQESKKGSRERDQNFLPELRLVGVRRAT